MNKQRKMPSIVKQDHPLTRKELFSKYKLIQISIDREKFVGKLEKIIKQKLDL